MRVILGSTSGVVGGHYSGVQRARFYDDSFAHNRCRRQRRIKKIKVLCAALKR